LISFVRSAAPDYLSFLDRTYRSDWSRFPAHVARIAEYCQAVLDGDLKRLIVSMPPRHGKTENLTVRLPVAALSHRPDRSFLMTGYNERFAQRLARKARSVAASVVALSGEKSASDEWETSAGGVLMARGVGSPPTGVGFDGVVVDDPVRNRAQADSVVFRDRVWEWWQDDLATRLQPGAWVVVVMTRWHEDDLAGRLKALEPGEWTELALPALSGDDEALWPETFDASYLRRRRETMDPRSWSALYQQSPAPGSGGLFDVDRVAVVQDVPPRLRRCRAWDVGATTKGDWTVGLLLEGPDGSGRFYATDVDRFRLGPGDRDARMRRVAEADGPETTVVVPEDPGAAGVAQVAAWARLFAGFRFRAVRPTGSKEVRAGPVAAQAGAGNLRVLAGPWNRKFLDELASFPLGQNDDQVDALSDAFRELCSRGSAEAFWA
jgi:predicted phage terminase large subunit-like protein